MSGQTGEGRMSDGRMSWGRTPTDGKPYYCTRCGAGFDEFMACEMPKCELESPKEAQAREQDDDEC